MHATRLFVSYPRATAESVRALAGHLEQLGLDVWLDQQLSGGQDWWDTILERIRNCDCFMFMVCEEALQSKGCRAELEYAYQVDRVILPMVIGPLVPDEVLPRYLSKLQRVDAKDPVQVARALLHLPDPRPLPSPLPEPPPVPISYLDELADVVDQPALTLAEQRNLVGALKERLAQNEDRDGAITLLHRLRRRSDVYAGVADEVDAAVAAYGATAEARASAGPGSASVDAERSSGPEPPASAPQSYPPSPAPPRMTGHPPTSRGKAVAALAAVGVLALGGIGAAIALAGDDDSSPPPSTPTTAESPSTGDGPDAVGPIDVVVVTPGLPDSNGDDPHLDELADYCFDGSLGDCDQLYLDSPRGSAYEEFGTTCGATSDLPLAGECAAVFDPDLNDGVAACDAGDMVACDDLYWGSDADSAYEEFGTYCGGWSDTPLFGECEITLGG